MAFPHHGSVPRLGGRAPAKTADTVWVGCLVDVCCRFQKHEGASETPRRKNAQEMWGTAGALKDAQRASGKDKIRILAQLFLLPPPASATSVIYRTKLTFCPKMWIFRE